MNEFLVRVNRYVVSTLILALTCGLFYNMLGMALSNGLLYRSSNDFLAVHTAVNVIRKGEIGKLYTFEAQREVQKHILFVNIHSNMMTYKLLPLPALLLANTGATPISLYLLLVLINFVLLLIFAFIFTAKFARKYSVIWFFTFLSLGLLNLPILTNMFNGQFSQIVALIVLVVYWKLKTKKELVAGIIFGLIWIKPNFLAMLPPLLLLASFDKQKFLTGFLISSSLFLGINILAYKSVSLPIDYIKFLKASEGPIGGTLIFRNFNIVALLGELGATYDNVMQLAVLCYFLVLALLALRKPQTLEKALSLSILVSVLFNIHTQIIDLLLLLVVLLLMYPKLRTRLSQWGMIFLFYLTPWFAYITEAPIITIGYLFFTLFLWLDIKIDASDT